MQARAYEDCPAWRLGCPAAWKLMCFEAWSIEGWGAFLVVGRLQTVAGLANSRLGGCKGLGSSLSDPLTHPSIRIRLAPPTPRCPAAQVAALTLATHPQPESQCHSHQPSPKSVLAVQLSRRYSPTGPFHCSQSDSLPDFRSHARPGHLPTVAASRMHEQTRTHPHSQSDSQTQWP